MKHIQNLRGYLTVSILLALLIQGAAHAATLHFLAIGDAGSGTVMQTTVADAMGKYAQKTQATSPLNFVLFLGDNFYPEGVTSVRDPQWNTKFESIYESKALPVPFL